MEIALPEVLYPLDVFLTSLGLCVGSPSNLSGVDDGLALRAVACGGQLSLNRMEWP